MTSSPLLRGVPRAKRSQPTAPVAPSLSMHVGVWASYGCLLMLPWIGTYPISVMLPNKLIIATTGALISYALRVVHEAFRREVGLTAERAALAVLTSLAAGFAWNASLVALIGSSDHALISLGRTEGGVPLLGGSLYHSLVMVAWSMASLAVAEVRPRDPAILPADPPVLLRDGSKTHVLDPRDIACIEADGDYVQVLVGERRLLLRYTLSALVDLLPSRVFVRIHRSTIVNVSRIRELRPRPNREYHVVLDNGVRLKASRTYADALRLRVGADMDSRPHKPRPQSGIPLR